jgi:hypothetical protein
MERWKPRPRETAIWREANVSSPYLVGLVQQRRALVRVRAAQAVALGVAGHRGFCAWVCPSVGDYVTVNGARTRRLPPGGVVWTILIPGLPENCWRSRRRLTGALALERVLHLCSVCKLRGAQRENRRILHRRGNAIVSVSNLRSSSQAGRGGFESHLPLHFSRATKTGPTPLTAKRSSTD